VFKGGGVKNKFDPVIRSSWVVLGLCVCSFVAILLLSMNSENDRWLESFWWLIIAVPVFIFDALFLLVIYSARDKYEKGRAAQQAGDYFVKWTFTQPEWERFLKDDWRKTKKESDYRLRDRHCAVHDHCPCSGRG
jgi:hypothetical protein